MARFTLSFRGKLDEDGWVKIPAIKSHHLSLVGNEDMMTTLFCEGLNNQIVTRKRLENMRGAETGDYWWPGYAKPETEGFVITPIGRGFMADVTIELDTDNMRRPRPAWDGVS